MARGGWLGVVLAVVLAGPAGAERRGSVVDKQDRPESLDGPGRSDIQRVTTKYDAGAGKVAIRVTFYTPFVLYRETDDGYALSDNFDYSLGTIDKSGRCSPVRGAPSGLDDYVEVHGFTGSMQGSLFAAKDRLHATIRFEHATLRHRDLQCFRMRLWENEESTADDPDSRYNEDCGCWVVSTLGDVVRTGYFRGFRP